MRPEVAERSVSFESSVPLERSVQLDEPLRRCPWVHGDRSRLSANPARGIAAPGCPECG